jgi:MYXO-CTERM domain-containing protein
LRRPRAHVAAAALALAAAVATGAPSDVVEEVIREAPPLVFHHPRGYEGVVEALAAGGAREVRRISAALGLPEPSRIDVYVLPRKAGVDPRSWGVPPGPEWAAGIALSDRPVVVLRTAEDSGRPGSEVATVFSHELVHAVVALGLPDRRGDLPAWLQEGVASHLAFEWRLADGAHVLRLTLSGRYVPLARLTSSFPASGPDLELAYLESFAFVNWLVERRGPRALPVLFERLAAGQAFEPAFRAAFGGTPRELEALFRRSFARRYRWLPIVTSSTTAWLAATGLVLAGWWRRRRQRERRMAEWEREERLAPAAAPEADPLRTPPDADAATSTKGRDGPPPSP